MNTEEKITEWMHKVLKAKTASDSGFTDTYKIMVEIDRIIAEEFNRTPVLPENQ